MMTEIDTPRSDLELAVDLHTGQVAGETGMDVVDSQDVMRIVMAVMRIADPTLMSMEI
jgi:hypothetical protein